MGDNGRPTVATVACLGVLSLGLVVLAIGQVSTGREVSPAIWQLLSAITGGLLALLPGWQKLN